MSLPVASAASNLSAVTSSNAKKTARREAIAFKSLLFPKSDM